MRDRFSLKGVFALLLIWAILWVGGSPIAQAQSPEASNGSISTPDFSIESLEKRLANIRASDDIDDAKKQIISATYQSAIQALQTARQNNEKAAIVAAEMNNAQQIIDGLRDRIERSERPPVPTTVRDMRTGEDLQRLEQERVLKEGELRNFEAQLAGYRSEIQIQSERSLQDDLVSARKALATQTSRRDALSENSDGPVERSQKALIEAREFEWRTKIQALERELTFQPTRLQILELKRDVAQLSFDIAQQEVINLQLKTGIRRYRIAANTFQETARNLSVLENSHPFVLDYAGENLSIAKQMRDIAESASEYPSKQARARSQLADVDIDLEVAEGLTSLGEFNRQSSATLRQLRDQRVSVKIIDSQISANERNRLAATQNQLWARQQLRKMPLIRPDHRILMTDWKETQPNSASLTNSDIVELEALYFMRRSLLLDFTETASNEIREARQLELVQNSLYSKTEQLSGILDQNLIWLPSVRAIDSTWPERVWRGTLSVFSFKNIGSTFDVLGSEFRQLWLPLIGILLLTVFLYALQPRIKREIANTAGKVGRVKKDSYWHSPQVLLLTALLTAPIPILLLLFGLVFKNSANPDPFIDAFGQTGIELSGFVWFLFMWREINKDKSLFGTHFKSHRFFRENTRKNLPWFIPLGGIAIALVTLTQNSREPDIYEGFSLLAFIVTALILGWFGFKMIGIKKAELESSFPENSLLRRYYRLFIVLVIVFPIAAAILAAIGYYDTARELLSRMLFSSGLVIVSYTIYGLLRRSVLVAQRRLSLQQAIDRREQALRQRKEQAEAEERGETPPPPLDYEEIDLETLEVQSGQIIKTVVMLGFAVAMWVFWQDLFPALSVFDEVKLWPASFEEMNGRVVAVDHITLWNLIQSLAIGALTFIAAKNLPGLLDVFILNRSRLERGTRYAVNSVIRYLIFIIGFVWAFSRLGLDWSQLQWVAAALSVGIGFGLQEIIANFISGLIILFERPIRVGDYISIGDKSGTVRRIQIRATTLSDLDKREIFIPNKELITQKVTNWTLSDSITRIIVPVGIAYGSDTEKARDIMIKVLEDNKRVLRQPKSNVYFLGFGESALDFELRIFVRSVDDRFEVSHDIHTDINKALGEAGFEIPFPQMDLKIKPRS